MLQEKGDQIVSAVWRMTVAWHSYQMRLPHKRCGFRSWELLFLPFSIFFSSHRLY